MHAATGWTPDGRTFLYHLNSSGTSNDIYAVRIDSAISRPYLQTAADEHSPAVSPDGRWIAYTSNESAREEVYVRSFPSPGEKWQVSIDGRTEPKWSPDGRELFYRSATG